MSNMIPIADGHSDIVVDVLRRRQDGERAVFQRYHAEPLRRANHRFLMMSTGGDAPSQNIGSDDPFWCAMMRIEALLADFADSAESVSLCLSMADVDRSAAEGKLGVMMMIEGASPLRTSLEALDLMYRLGIRSVQLTWNARNMVGDGCGEAITGSGLTRFGRSLVQALNRKKMLLDLSHASDALFFSAAELTTAPFIVSHANARAVCNHPRNLTDRQMELLAARRGVIGLCLFPWFVDPERPSIERLLDHLDHMVSVVGIDHVSIGADFIYFAPDVFAREINAKDKTGMYAKGFDIPPDLRDLSAYPLLQEGIRKRGYSEADIAKVCSENLFRVYREVIG
ncbi:MAG: dipeptidase [Hyphomicrobiaceae bacterium]|nr:dipeptidase [Hyphomicrobiaceae bacterium]